MARQMSSISTTIGGNIGNLLLPDVTHFPIFLIPLEYNTHESPPAQTAQPTT